MKKIFFVLFSSVLFLSACASTDVIISFNQLPDAAQQFVNQYFGTETISFVKAEKEGLHTDYEVLFANGTEIEFDGKGNLEQVDCKRLAVPDGIVPEQIMSVVKAQFPTNFVVQYSIDRHDYEVELNNDVELKFSKSFQLLEID